MELSKIVCANCGRNSGIGHFDYRDKSGSSLCIIFLCDVCKILLKTININLTVDEKKLNVLKKVMRMNKERIEESEKNP